MVDYYMKDPENYNGLVMANDRSVLDVERLRYWSRVPHQKDEESFGGAEYGRFVEDYIEFLYGDVRIA